MRRRGLAIAPAVIATLLLLAACGNPGSGTTASAGASGSASASASASATPTAAPAPSAPAAPADAVLVITATVTSTSGSVMHLSETVLKSLAWNDPAAADRAALMSQVCAGALDDTVYSANLWSFAKIQVTAKADGAWPTDGSRDIQLEPFAQYLAVATDGYPMNDPYAAADTPFCKTDKYLRGPGSGTAVVGFQGDTDAVGAAGGFTKWANHRYGFSAKEVATQTPADTGMTVSDCSITVTPLGMSLGGGNLTNTQSDGTECIIGISTIEDSDS